MSDSQDSYALDHRFDMKGYVTATDDAASRTRTVTIVLVVASVLVGIGWYNSLSTSWQLHRMRSAYYWNEEDICEFLDCATHPELREKEDGDKYPVSNNWRQFWQEEVSKKSPAGKFQNQLRQEVVKAYVENVRTIRAPFFGTVREGSIPSIKSPP